MNKAENKREYEMSFLLTPGIPEDRVDFEAGELKKLILENGGTNIEISAPVNKRLAYPVKKQNQAYFGVVYFNIDSDGLDKVKSVLTHNTKFLRFFILNNPIKPRVKSAGQTTSEMPSRIQEMPLRKEKTTEVPTESFDKKLESILGR